MNNQQELNDHLIRENIRLQAQIDLLTWAALDVAANRMKFDVSLLNTNQVRDRQMEEFMLEGIKKYQIPLIEASLLLNESQKEMLIAEISEIKYMPPKPDKNTRKYFEE